MKAIEIIARKHIVRLDGSGVLGLLRPLQFGFGALVKIVVILRVHRGIFM